MVKELLKQVFITGENNYFQFPMPHLLLSDNLRELYKNYYLEGAGSVLFTVVLYSALGIAVIGNKAERIVAKVLLCIYILFYVSQSQMIANTVFYTNAFGLPVLHFPVWLLYLLALPLAFLVITSVRTRLHGYVRPTIVRLWDLVVVVLCICATMPWWSGEL